MGRMPAPAATSRIVAIVLAANLFFVPISQAESWSPSLRIAGGLSTFEGDLTPWLGLAGHVVHDDAWIRLGIEGAWWEQLGHFGVTTDTGTGPHPYQARFTNFLMGAVVQLSPAEDRAPVYLVLGVADLVVVEKLAYFDAPTQSEWGHAPTLSGGIGYAVTDGFGQNVEARWYWRRAEPDRIVPNRYFTLSAGVRF